jgi:alanine transaminase
MGFNKVPKSYLNQFHIQDDTSFPFKSVIWISLGDPQAMGQQPITLIRQVLACVSYPKLLDSNEFPIDVKQRARLLLDVCGGQSVGKF